MNLEKIATEKKEISEFYDDLPFWSCHSGITLLDNIPLLDNVEMLDIGCGTGFPTLELAQRIGESSRVYGVDLWEDGIVIAKQKAINKRIGNVEFAIENAKKLSYSEERFEIVVSNNGISAIEDKKAVLKEVYRVMKKNGKLIFTAILPDTMRDFYNLLIQTMKEVGINSASEQVKMHINKRRLALNEYMKLLCEIGFDVKKYSNHNYNMNFRDSKAIFEYDFFKSHFVKGWYEIVEETKRKQVFENLMNKLDSFATNNIGISLNIEYTLIICEK